MYRMIALAVSTACFSLSGALAKPDSLKSAPQQVRVGEAEAWRPALFLSGEYVAAGDVDSRPLDELATHGSNLMLGIEQSVTTPDKTWEVSWDASAGLADDLLPKDEDGTTLGASAKLRLAIWDWVSPYVSLEVEKGFGDFYETAKATSTSGKVGVAFKISVAPPSQWGIAKDKLALKLEPSFAHVESSDRADDVRKYKAVATLDGINVRDVSVELSGQLSSARGRHHIAGKAYRRKDDGAEVSLAVGLVDLLGALAPEWKAAGRLKLLNELKLQGRWVSQESNSGDPAHTYSRWQFVPALRLKRPF